MKVFNPATIAACALLPMSAIAQSSFPAPPPELSVSTEGPEFLVGTGPEMGLSVADEPEVLFLAQNTAPAPPQGGGNAVYMTQGPGGPGRPAPVTTSRCACPVRASGGRIPRR